MNPRERLLGAMRGQPIDRVPIILHGFMCQSYDDMAKISDPFKKDIMSRIIDETHFTMQVASYINRMLVTPPQRIKTQQKALPNGNIQSYGIIDTPKGNLTFETLWDPQSQTSWMVKYPVENLADIEKIASVPWELPDGIKPPNFDSMPKGFSERGILATHISSPFVCVSAMMNFEMFLEFCYTENELIKELTEVCKDRIMDCIRILMSKPGIEYVWIGGSEWITPPMAPPDIYDELVQAQEKDIIEYIHKNSNAITHIHCHGNIRNIISKMIERGGDYTEPVEPPPDGDITLSEAKQKSAGKITLGGNIECRILCNESEDIVEKAVIDAFDGGKFRFILTQTAEHSPILGEQEYKNYIRMIDLWEELSQA